MLAVLSWFQVVLMGEHENEKSRFRTGSHNNWFGLAECGLVRNSIAMLDFHVMEPIATLAWNAWQLQRWRGMLGRAY